MLSHNQRVLHGCKSVRALSLVDCLTPDGLPSTLTRDYEDDATRVYPNNQTP